MLFKQFEDSQITTKPDNRNFAFQASDFPRVFPGFKRYPTDGMNYYDANKYVYMNCALYKDPDFFIFRERLHPIIMRYIQPEPNLQEQIDIIGQKMNTISNESEPNNQTSNQSNLKIGIHVRSLIHYNNCNKSETQFLDDIEKDVDEIMKSKNLDTTQIFLATLLEPLIERLSAKYRVVTSPNVIRTSDVSQDWGSIPNLTHLDAARSAIVDTWCLANCDELWGSSSNMIIFAGCLNPSLEIHMLPSLENYNGH